MAGLMAPTALPSTTTSSSEHVHPKSRDVVLPFTAAVRRVPELSRQPCSDEIAGHSPSTWAHNSIFACVAQHSINQTLWRDYEIPGELGLIQAGTPVEIRRIVKASLDTDRVHRGASVRYRLPGDDDSGTAGQASRSRLELSPSQGAMSQ